MDELELESILSATLVHLKMQMVYLRNLNESFAALYDSVAQVYPGLDSIYKEEIRKIRANPVQAEHIREIDELLVRVANLEKETRRGPRLPGL